MKNKIWKLLIISILIIGMLTACDSEQMLLEEYAADEQSEEEAGTQEAEETAGPEYICVHICGAVSMPGVYELPYGSRIYEVLELAGGFDEQADRDAVNLVEPLADGQQVRVPFVGEINADDNDGLIDINRADVSALCEIPGIGESRAQAIVDYRDEYGNFQSIEDLMEIPGIKEGIFARISPYVKCGN